MVFLTDLKLVPSSEVRRFSSQNHGHIQVSPLVTQLPWPHNAGFRGHGKQILATVSQELTAKRGRRFGNAEIARIMQFSSLFPDEGIVVTLSRQLNGSPIHALLPI